MPHEKESRSFAFLVAAGILLSRIAGFVRERVFAHYLGVSDGAGAFKAALRIPNLLVNLLGEGVLSASFIPVYASLVETDPELAGRVASVVASLLTLAVALVSSLGAWAAPWIIDAVAPGFHGDVRDLTVRLVAIMFPGVGLLTLCAWCLGVLNSHRQFFVSYVAPVLWNLAQIALLVAVGARFASTRAGQMHLAVLLAWATVAGAALQLAVQLPTALRLVRHFRPSLATSLAPVREVLSNFVPNVVSRGVVQVSAYIDQLLASYLGPAIVSAMSYAQILYTLPVSLFGMSVAAAELPELSRLAAGDVDEAQKAKLRFRLEANLSRIAFYVVPTTVAFLALGDLVVGTLFQNGAFVHRDTVIVWIILAGSTVGLLAATQGRLFSSTFYAMKDTRTPLRYALVRVSLTAVLGWAIALPLRRHFGLSPSVAAAGLTASAGVAGWLEYLLLRRGIERRVGKVVTDVAGLVRPWATALACGGATFALGRVVGHRHPLVTGAALLGGYGALYVLGTALLGVSESRLLLERLSRRLRRRR